MPFVKLNNGHERSCDNIKKTMLNLLIDKTMVVGKKLTMYDVMSDPEMPEPNSYAFYFGSFDSAANVAEIEAGKKLVTGEEKTKQESDSRKTELDNRPVNPLSKKTVDNGKVVRSRRSVRRKNK